MKLVLASATRRPIHTLRVRAKDRGFLPACGLHMHTGKHRTHMRELRPGRWYMHWSELLPECDDLRPRLNLRESCHDEGDLQSRTYCMRYRRHAPFELGERYHQE